MPAQNTHERTTAQIACEAIINHEHDGYTLADMAAVFEIATRERVGALYVEMLVEVIGRAVAACRSSFDERFAADYPLTDELAEGDQ